MTYDDPDDYIGFSVKAKDTEHNQKVFDWFFNFAKRHAKNDYTIALNTLKEQRESRLSTLVLIDKILDMEERIAKLEQEKRTSTPQERNGGNTF